ncbi:MAG: glycosyltransferase family 4 protein [Chthoniobacteraceae bacterium]
MMPCNWICCQLGAREHYAVPRALHDLQRLSLLFTDAWVNPGSPLGCIRRALRERYDSKLVNSLVATATNRLILFEAICRSRGIKGWPLIIKRNRWFQKQAIRTLDASPASLDIPGHRNVLFAYSYAALEIFRWAKLRGWKTVLGQIDPGPVEACLVDRLAEEHPNLAVAHKNPPISYWQHWREECDIADVIVVNSNWSREGLRKEGVASDKISVVPLAYNLSIASASFSRIYPSVFTTERPLRVLFLGQANLRKGIAEVLNAISLVSGSAIELWVVGPVQIAASQDNPQIKWFGAVPRSRTAIFYQRADVFLFPTHSDGFGLTQLEAQAWKLPVITTRFCGEVIKDGHNGIVLETVSGLCIANVLLRLLRKPSELAHMAANSGVGPSFHIDALGRQLVELE